MHRNILGSRILGNIPIDVVTTVDSPATGFGWWGIVKERDGVAVGVPLLGRDASRQRNHPTFGGIPSKLLIRIVRIERIAAYF
jgi:hypothetical protein